MSAKDCEALDTLVFGPEGKSLVDFRCFRGDREDVSEDDIQKQIHSAMMQKRMKRAVIGARAPNSGVEPQNVREFVNGLASLA